MKQDTLTENNIPLASEAKYSNFTGDFVTGVNKRLAKFQESFREAAITVQRRKETTKEVVAQFINKYANTQLKTDLLFFWSRYPNAKFTLGVIARGLDCTTRRADVEEAIESLAEAELVEKHIQQGSLFYCLTTDSERREPFLRLSACSRGYFPTSAHARRQRLAQLISISAEASIG